MNTTAGRSGGGRSQRLVLVRHGETADNVAGRFLGRSDPDLTDRGRAQARLLSPRVTALVDVTVVTSPARRAVSTAEELGAAATVSDGAFREIDFGDWEGLTQSEVAERDPVGFAAFARGDIDAFPGGESVHAVAERTVAALRTYDASMLLVVTHATVVRILVTALLGLPVARYRALFARPSHLSWTELESTVDGWMLHTYSSPLVGVDR